MDNVSLLLMSLEDFTNNVYTLLALLDVKTYIDFLSTCHTGGQWRVMTSETDLQLVGQKVVMQLGILWVVNG